MEIFQTVYVRTKPSPPVTPENLQSLWASNEVRFGHYLPDQSAEGCEDDSDTHPQQAGGCHTLQALVFTCFAVVWSTNSFSRRTRECLIREHHTVCPVLTPDSAAPFEWEKTQI